MVLFCFVLTNLAPGMQNSDANIVFPPEIKKGMVNFLRKGHFSVNLRIKGTAKIYLLYVVTVFTLI